jgi:lipoprotein-releasing system ATP-binding protein
MADADQKVRPLVEVRDLSKTFFLGGRRIDVLRGINLTLRRGEMLSVVGKSGVGKSTLLHILGTLDLPSSGDITFDGVEVTSMSPATLADFRNRSIGFVFQFHHLLPEFTALENVMMPALIQRMPREEARRLAMAILDRVGLSDRLDHKPGLMSGGEQQRVARARALVLHPVLLLADEPTGNLDTRTGGEIHDLFFELNRERGITMMIVTHNEELAARMPRQLHMVDGNIVEPLAVSAPALEEAPVP